MTSEKKDKGPCATPGCWEDAVCAGFCSACYAGWRRLRDLELPELRDYFRRIERLGSRARCRMNRQDPRQATLLIVGHKRHLKRVS